MELTRVVPATCHKFLIGARRDLVIKNQPPSFETNLKGTMNVRSTDPRDKIYGILGLVSK